VEGAGRLSTATHEENERASDMVLLVRQVTFDEVANHLQTSHGSEFEIIHDSLQFRRVCARWVPKQLATLHEQTPWDISQQYLDRYGKERENTAVGICCADHP
jgi:hypothetical protein